PCSSSGQFRTWSFTFNAGLLEHLVMQPRPLWSLIGGAFLVPVAFLMAYPLLRQSGPLEIGFGLLLLVPSFSVSIFLLGLVSQESASGLQSKGELERLLTLKEEGSLHERTLRMRELASRTRRRRRYPLSGALQHNC